MSDSTNLLRKAARFEPGKWQNIGFYFQVAAPVVVTPEKMAEAMETVFGPGTKFAASK